MMNTMNVFCEVELPAPAFVNQKEVTVPRALCLRVWGRGGMTWRAGTTTTTTTTSVGFSCRVRGR